MTCRDLINGLFEERKRRSYKGWRMKKFLNRVSNRIVFRYIVAFFFLSSRVPPSFHVPRVYLPMETRALNEKGRREREREKRERQSDIEREREKEERGRGADPGFERAKKQGGAALGRVRGRVSPPSVGSEVAFRCDEDGRRGAPSRANAPRNAKSKCRCEPSCQPAILQVDALAGHETAAYFLFRRSPLSSLRTRAARGPRGLSPRWRPSPRDSKSKISNNNSRGELNRFADRSIVARVVETCATSVLRVFWHTRYGTRKVFRLSLVDRDIDLAPFVTTTCFRQRGFGDSTAPPRHRPRNLF